MSAGQTGGGSRGGGRGARRAWGVGSWGRRAGRWGALLVGLVGAAQAQAGADDFTEGFLGRCAQDAPLAACECVLERLERADAAGHPAGVDEATLDAAASGCWTAAAQPGAGSLRELARRARLALGAGDVAALLALAPGGLDVAVGDDGEARWTPGAPPPEALHLGAAASAGRLGDAARWRLEPTAGRVVYQAAPGQQLRLIGAQRADGRWWLTRVERVAAP